MKHAMSLLDIDDFSRSFHLKQRKIVVKNMIFASFKCKETGLIDVSTETVSGKSLGDLLPLDVFLDMIESSMASLEDKDGILASGMLNLTKVESNAMQCNSQSLPKSQILRKIQ